MTSRTDNVEEAMDTTNMDCSPTQTENGTPFVPCSMDAGCQHKYTCRIVHICLESLTVRKRS